MCLNVIRENILCKSVTNNAGIQSASFKLKEDIKQLRFDWPKWNLESWLNLHIKQHLFQTQHPVQKRT